MTSSQPHPPADAIYVSEGHDDLDGDRVTGCFTAFSAGDGPEFDEPRPLQDVLAWARPLSGLVEVSFGGRDYTAGSLRIPGLPELGDLEHQEFRARYWYEHPSGTQAPVWVRVVSETQEISDLRWAAVRQLGLADATRRAATPEAFEALVEPDPMLSAYDRMRVIVEEADLQMTPGRGLYEAGLRPPSDFCNRSGFEIQIAVERAK